MTRFIRALLCALGGVGVLISSCDLGSGVVFLLEARAAEPAPNASDCLNFQNDVQERGIVVHGKNVCERRLTCSLTYVVRCEDHAGKVTSSTRGTARFALAAQGTSNVEMSADQCKQGWNIDDVSWVCS